VTAATIAAAYGVALVLAGGLAATAFGARHDELILGRIGLSPHSGRPRPRIASARLARLAARRGWSGDPLAFAAANAAAALLGGVLGWRLAGPVGALGGVLAGVGVVEWRLARARDRRAERLEAQLREAVMALAAGVRAGLSVRRAFDEAVRDAEEPMRGHLRETLRRVEMGEPLDDAVVTLASDVESSEARLLVTALAVHQRTGGELPAMLEEVASIIGQRVDARRQVRALTAQGRASGAVLAVLPVAFVTLLSGTSGDGLGAFYRTPLGAGLLLAGLLLEGAGFLWIRRIVRPSG
jgi:tight adherence protein B